MAFFEFNIATSGLFAAQRGLNVTSNNIANASTESYTRQVLKQKADTPLSGIGVGMTGTGVQTTGVHRVRDSYIDLKLWSQNPKLGEYNVKVTQSALVEGAFGEPSDTGFTKLFDKLFSSMSDFARDTTSGDAKVAVKENLVSFAGYYSNIAETLKSYQQNLNFEVKATVDEINILGSRIQSLNDQIFKAEIYGDDANSFRDERDACIDRLSEIVDVKAKEEEKDINGRILKTFRVEIAGQTLVDHVNLNTLSVLPRGIAEANFNDHVRSLSELNTEYAGLKDIEAAGTATPQQNQRIVDIENQMQTLSGKLAGLNAAVTTPTVSFTRANGSTYTAVQYQVSYEGNAILGGNNIPVALVSQRLNEEDVDGLYDIKWSNGLTFDMTSNRMSGELKGLIDMRDGCGTGNEVTYNGIPYYIGRLDDYVREFARTMNEAYSTDENGYIKVANNPDGITHIKRTSTGTEYYTYDATTKEYNGTASGPVNDTTYTAENALFSYTTGDSTGTPVAAGNIDYKQMTASYFSVSKELFQGANNMIATYDELNGVNNSNVSDGTFWSTIAAQKNNKHMFAEGTPSDYMVSIFSEFGINTQEAKMYQSTQESVTNVIKNQRNSFSQVDLTEEFSSLIKYQQAYQASAKIINTIDGIYETTIFKLGNF